MSLFSPVSNPDQLEGLVLKIGFLPFFRCGVEGFSIEELTPPALWFAEDVDGPWEWKGPVARRGRVLYGKFFCGKAGYVSAEWFPDLANWRRDGYDFDARYEDGLAPHRDRELMRFIAERGALLSGELRELCGCGKGGARGFDGMVSRLQMQTYLSARDFVYKKDRLGQSYGWGVALYDAPENILGGGAVRAAYGREPAESRERMLRHLKGLLPKAADGALERLIK